VRRRRRRGRKETKRLSTFDFNLQKMLISLGSACQKGESCLCRTLTGKVRGSSLTGAAVVGTTGGGGRALISIAPKPLQALTCYGNQIMESSAGGATPGNVIGNYYQETFSSSLIEEMEHSFQVTLGAAAEPSPG